MSFRTSLINSDTMKYINYLLFAIIGYFVIFRFVVPKLISTNNDLAVFCGGVIGVVVVYYVIYAIYTQIKGEE